MSASKIPVASGSVRTARAKAPALRATRTTFTFFLLLCSLAAVSAQNQGRWVRLAPILEANEEFDSAVVNGKLYLFGGNPVAVAGKQGAPPGHVFEYDPAADRWTKKKNMPQAAHHNGVVGYNGKIFVFGGGVQRQPGGPTQFPIDNSWEYDPVADSWRALARMPLRRLAAAAVESGGKIYVMGGVAQYEGLEHAVARRGRAATGCSTSTTSTILRPTPGKRARPDPTPANHMFVGAGNTERST